MAGSPVLAYLAVRQRDVAQHRAWMMCAYAIGQGAGTQALTQAPVLLTIGRPDDLSMALLMGGAWVINLVVAEWIIRHKPGRVGGPARAVAGA